VVLSKEDFKAIMEELEDIELYEAAKKEDTGESMLLAEYLKNRKSKNA